MTVMYFIVMISLSMTRTTTTHSDNHILQGQKEKQYDLDKHPAVRYNKHVDAHCHYVSQFN